MYEIFLNLFFLLNAKRDLFLDLFSAAAVIKVEIDNWSKKWISSYNYLLWGGGGRGGIGNRDKFPSACI